MLHPFIWLIISVANLMPLGGDFERLPLFFVFLAIQLRFIWVSE
jgi:hypothetical protein